MQPIEGRTEIKNVLYFIDEILPTSQCPNLASVWDERPPSTKPNKCGSRGIHSLLAYPRIFDPKALPLLYKPILIILDDLVLSELQTMKRKITTNKIPR